MKSRVLRRELALCGLLLLIALGLATVNARAATTTLIASNSIWRYLADGSDAGTAWRSAAFDDAGWSNGVAKLGFGNDGEATSIGAAANGFTTFYFRRTFIDSGATTFNQVQFRLLRDDGAVVYLNGVELFRQNMPAGAVTYLTLAAATVSGATENTYFATNVPAALALLQPGANTLAVEVHQVDTSSSDLGFNLELAGIVDTAPPSVTLTNPPGNVAILVGETVALGASAEDDSGVAQVEFYANGSLLGMDTTEPYGAALRNARVGSYELTAVAQDIAGLRATSAPVTINVTFGAGAVILTANRTCWQYWDRGTAPASGWNEPGFDDTDWGTGFAELGYGDGDEATTVSFGVDPDNKHRTTWFRQILPVTEIDALTNLVLKVKRDDGVVVYLNGVEVFRDNLPPGAITPGTLALLAATDDGAGYLETNVSPTLLLHGQNVLAAEIHQAAIDSSDISFDAILVGQSSTAAPPLGIASVGNSVVISWPAEFATAALESSVALGPLASWAEVPIEPSTIGEQKSVTLPIGGDGRFFRLAGVEASLCQPPLVLTQELAVAASIGRDVTLTIPVVGTPPFTFQWRVNDIHLEGATNQSLNLSNVQRADGGAYQAVIINSCGCTFSCPINLVVDGEAFRLTDEFAARPTTNSLAGAVNTTNVGATLEAGEPPLPFERAGRSLWLQWVAPSTGVAEFDTDGSGQSTALAVYDGASLASLSTQAVAGNDRPHLTSRVQFNASAGHAYQISVDGSGGGSTLCLNWQLTAPAPLVPQIIIPPLTQSATIETPVTFSVVATNATSYQWRFNGLAIPDATNSTYLIASATSTDTGVYDVLVGNLSLVVTSPPASLRTSTSTGPSSGITYLPLADFRYGSSCKVGSKTVNYSKALGFCLYAPSTPVTLPSCGTSLYAGGWIGGPINNQGFTQLTIDTVYDPNNTLDTALYYFPITGSTKACSFRCAEDNNVNDMACPRLAKATFPMCSANTIIRVVFMLATGQPSCNGLPQPPTTVPAGNAAFEWNYN